MGAVSATEAPVAIALARTLTCAHAPRLRAALAGLLLVLASGCGKDSSTAGEGLNAGGGAPPLAEQAGMLKRNTEDLLGDLERAIERWKAKFGGYPPLDIRRVPMQMGASGAAPKSANVTNLGVESLLYALTRDPGMLSDWVEPKFVADVDGDAQGVPPLLRELVDGYGNPLVYFDNVSYRFSDAEAPTYVMKGGREVRPRPWREDGGGFRAPAGVQLFSCGPDGIPNTPDDIARWH